MHLIMFDIDGTLIHSSSLEEDCYIQAVTGVLGLARIDTDWATYPHVTDAGVATEIIGRAFHREPRAEELDAIRDRYVELLKCAHADNPAMCRPMAGVEQMLEQLLRMPGTAVALATGGWSASAHFKLREAGLAAGALPFASADDALAREDIMLAARSRAAQHHGVSQFSSCVYVGDGLWDLKASRRLDFGFVGIGTGERGRKLTDAGASRLFADFSDAERFINAITKHRGQSL